MVGNKVVGRKPREDSMLDSFIFRIEAVGLLDNASAGPNNTEISEKDLFKSILILICFPFIGGFWWVHGKESFSYEVWQACRSVQPK
jgi:hypothetical protein